MADWRTSAAKKLLQKALRNGDIPTDTKVMGPKAVYEKYKDHPEFDGIDYDNTFTRRLRDLRKQEIHVDDEKDVAVDWKNSAAKQFIKELFKSKTIPLDYSATIGAKQVWDLHCKNDPAFVGMNYNDTFKRRLKSVCDDHARKDERADKDLEAYLNYQKLHPRPTHNARGEPQWDGSKAQEWLKHDVTAGTHLEYENKPSQLRLTRPEYQLFGVDTFRAHLHQELRLRKYYNYRDKKRNDDDAKVQKELKKQSAKAAKAEEAKAEKEAKKAAAAAAARGAPA